MAADRPIARTAAAAHTPKPAERDKPFHWGWMMVCVTVFQIFSFVPVAFPDGEMQDTIALVFGVYIALEWMSILVMQAVTRHGDFPLEILAFFLSGIGLTICASIHESYALKQLIAIGLGVVSFVVLTYFIRSTDRAMLVRTPLAVGAIALLILNLLLAKVTNGALNWITVGPVSFQPSELVKAAFIFVGAATLESLQTTRSLTKYIVFSLACVGALFIMRDFGTALIFFFTFILIAFMRSGDFRTLVLISAAALMGALLVIYFKPYVANRFAIYRHVWEYINDKGFQQTRVLIYSASGGLLGLGVGNGRLRTVFAASTDLVFGMVCEEWGLLLGVLILFVFAFVALYAVRGARKSSSTFYSIAAVSAAGMLLFQLALNVFGITDLLPMTGVTLPFISRGGTSMICAWALFAFVKSVSYNIGDTKPYRGRKRKGAARK